MGKRDYYEVLGVSKEATKDEIKKAYRKQAIKFHPDKNPGDKKSEENFKEAAEAYEVLSNDEKKARYDRFGHAGMGGAGNVYGGHGMTVEDIFSSFGDIFGDAFGGFGGFGGGSRRGKRVSKGTNLRIKVKLTLQEIASGTEKKLKVSKYDTCDTCHGSGAADASSMSACSTCHGSGHITRITNTMLGQMQTSSVCPSCGGEGKTITKKCITCYGEGIIQKEEVIKINIPAGVAKGMQMTVGGKGNAPRRVFVILVTWPEPWHVAQSEWLLESAAPVPLHVEQGTYFLTFIFFSAPAAISCRLSLTFTRRLLPLLTLLPPPLLPLLKPPNPPKASPKISPNDEKISSTVMSWPP